MIRHGRFFRVAEFVAARQALMTREEFESIALHRLQTLYPRARFLKAGQLEIAILRTPSGRPSAHRLRLARAWAAFCQHGERFDLDGYLSRVVGTVEHKLPADWAAARSTILPKLALEETLHKQSPDALFYPLAGELGYALCGENAELNINREQLDRWEVAEECVLAAALDNLQKIWQRASIVAWTVQDHVRAFHIELRHVQKASLILLPQFYEQAAEILGCEALWAAVPNRQFLVAFAADDQDFRQTLEPILRKEWDGGVPLTRSLIRIEDGEFSLED